MSDPFLPEHGRIDQPDAAVRDEATSRSSSPAEPPPAARAVPPAGTRAPAPERFVPVTRTLLAATLAVAVLVSAVVWLDARRTQQLLRAEVAHRLDQIESAGQSVAKTQQQMASELRDAQAKITLLEARIAESQEQQAALEALYRDLSPSRDEIALTEIEQILLVASQQLQLAGNVPSALAALQLADAKLQRLDRPQFLPLRRAVSRDIDRLKGVPYVDVAGLSLRIDQIISLVDTLPLARDERLPQPDAQSNAPAQETSGWRRFVRDVWADLRQLIRIEVADRPAAPLVPPSQEYFLRENLKLRLLSARIGLLNHDDATFKADVAAADAWLKQYFDTRSKAVQTVQSILKQLAATPMPADLPDLARTLDAARVLRQATERATPGRGAGERQQGR
ncbi:MAG TPA: uroporphyrinogen-III C-methyltransferase [Casimicrobiaceae bacterium]|nr:uroporphyrinogen-III C-methyltransferase [Casimicrobiaceae bacterium]